MARSKKIGKTKSPSKGVRKAGAPRAVSLKLVPAPDATPIADAAPASVAAPPLASAASVVLPDVLDQAAAGMLHAELLSHRGADAVIDAGAVRRIGGQCLQILLSAAATWTHDGAALVVVNSSPEFIAGVRLLGIDPGELASEKPFAGVA